MIDYHTVLFWRQCTKPERLRIYIYILNIVTKREKQCSITMIPSPNFLCQQASLFGLWLDNNFHKNRRHRPNLHGLRWVHRSLCWQCHILSHESYQKWYVIHFTTYDWALHHWELGYMHFELTVRSFWVTGSQSWLPTSLMGKHSGNPSLNLCDQSINPDSRMTKHGLNQ